MLTPRFTLWCAPELVGTPGDYRYLERYGVSDSRMDPAPIIAYFGTAAAARAFILSLQQETTTHHERQPPDQSDADSNDRTGDS